MSLAAKKRMFLIIAIGGMLNFLVFVTIASVIGGDAVNGHQSDGHYFLANHGKYTEVTRPVFLYSRFHVYTLFCTSPLVVISAGMLNWYKRREASAQ